MRGAARVRLLHGGVLCTLVAANAALFANWSVAQPWKPDRRYTARGTYSQQDALDILNAIRDPNVGILRWIAKYW